VVVRDATKTSSGGSRQAVRCGGDLWVAEERSATGGAPQARVVIKLAACCLNGANEVS
jgi:hypothetical protein